jgi:hypothetical protein
MAQVTHESAIVSSDDLTALDAEATAMDLAERSEIDGDCADKIAHILDVRDGNGDDDVLVEVAEWAYEDWSDYDISGSPFMVCGHVEDYSEKAFKVQSAHEVVMDALEGRSYDEVTDDYITNLVEQVDETQEDFHDERGERFLPKTAVEAIYVVDE